MTSQARPIRFSWTRGAHRLACALGVAVSSVAAAQVNLDRFAENYDLTRDAYRPVDRVPTIDLPVGQGLRLIPGTKPYREFDEPFLPFVAELGYRCISQREHVLVPLGRDAFTHDWKIRLPRGAAVQMLSQGTFTIDDPTFVTTFVLRRDGREHLVTLSYAAYEDETDLTVKTCGVERDVTKMRKDVLTLTPTNAAVQHVVVDALSRIRQCRSVQTPQPQQTQSHESPVNAAQVTARSTLLATSGWDENTPTLKLWDASTLALRWSVPLDNVAITVGFTDDARQLLTMTYTGKVEIRATDTGALRRAFPTPHGVAGTPHLSETGRYVYVLSRSTRDPWWEVWSVETGRRVARGESGENFFFDFSPDDREAYLVDDAGRVSVIDPASGRTVRTRAVPEFRTSKTTSIASVWVVSSTDVRVFRKTPKGANAITLDIYTWNPTSNTVRRTETRELPKTDWVSVDQQGRVKQYDNRCSLPRTE